jgi:hypothetical protein
LILGALVVAAACEFEPPDDPACVHEEFSLQVYATPVQRVDMLIWIDDSPSMTDEQFLLHQQLPLLIGELLTPEDNDGDTRPDHPPIQDLNVGIVAPGMPSTDALPGCWSSPTAETGCLLQAPAAALVGECDPTYPPFQSWNAFDDDASDAEGVAHAVQCLGAVGIAGCTFTQPFASVVQALTTQAAPGRCNEEFLRDDTMLYILWISDGDDGSASVAHPELFDLDEPLGEPSVRSALHPELLEPVDTFLDAIRRLKPVPNKIALGMIVGVPPDAPACSGSGDVLEGCLGVPAMQATLDPADPAKLIPSCANTWGVADPPRRFVQLAQAFGTYAAVVSICLSDWRDALGVVLDRLCQRLPDVCLPREIPLDEGECIPDCAVVDTLFDDRPCAEDPTCPSSWCPPAEEGDALDPPPCVDPATGAECRPFKRDLGVVTESDGVARRKCLMRPAARTWDATSGSCGAPEGAGWVYFAPDESPSACAQVVFTGASYWGGGLEPGSRGDLRCGWTTCDGL